VSSEGLQKAISVGDVRVIHLLLEAQPGRKLDSLGTLIYALRNAGGNKVQVVSYIMMAVADNVREDWHADIIDSEMDALRSKAMRERNREELEFIDAILETRWYEQLHDRKICQRESDKG
jgi:hypothetical protein